MRERGALRGWATQVAGIVATVGQMAAVTATAIAESTNPSNTKKNNITHVMTTNTSRPVLMIFRNQNTNPAIDVRHR